MGQNKVNQKSAILVAWKCQSDPRVVLLSVRINTTSHHTTTTTPRPDSLPLKQPKEIIFGIQIFLFLNEDDLIFFPMEEDPKLLKS